MKQFEDLEFKPKNLGGFSSHSIIGGHVLSVQCGSFAYCTPREDLDSPTKYASFEIAIWKDDSSQEWVTNQFTDTGDDSDADNIVAGWVGRDEITQIIKKLSKS